MYVCVREKKAINQLFYSIGKMKATLLIVIVLLIHSIIGELVQEINVHMIVAVTGRKRTLFHCKWANSISYRMLY